MLNLFKRAASLKNSQVVFNIYDDNGKFIECWPNFYAAAKRVEFLQDTYPDVKFDIKVELIK